MSTQESDVYTGVAKSMELYHQAGQLIPGATQLISRRPTLYAYGFSPAYAVSAKGARFTDVDGNEFVDWVSGIGAVILGYCDPVVDAAVKAKIDTGTMYSISHPSELELAELLIERIPCAEMVRFAKGGGDACAVAVRIARGTTGKDKILFCGYHGWHDWYMAANLIDDEELDSHLFPGIEPIGVPKSLAGTAIPFPYGDVQALDATLEKHVGEVAAIMMEPLRSTMPEPGYLESVRKIADKHGVLLIFDEVSTGFRPTAGGTQPLVGVTPDIAVFAKSISNGYPMGAVVGTRAAMEPASQMCFSSTYWSDTLGIQAAITSLTEVKNRDVPQTVQTTGRFMKEQTQKLIDEHGLPAEAAGVDWHPHFSFNVDNPETAKQLTTLFSQEMARRNVHMATSFYLNESHGDSECNQTLEAMNEAFNVISSGLATNSIAEKIECQPRVDIFRRLVS